MNDPDERTEAAATSMLEARIWFVPPSAVTSSTVGRYPKKWSYLGTSARKYRVAATALGLSQQVDLGREFETVAESVRRKYLDMVGNLTRVQSSPLLWWSSAIASRSPLQTDSFYLICFLFLCQRFVEEDVGERLVIVEDPWLFSQLHMRYRNHPGVALVGLPRLRLWFDRAYWVLRFPVSIAHFLFNALWRRFWLGPPSAVLSEPAGERRVVVIAGWLRPDQFAGDGFRDVYFGSLPDWLRSRHIELWRLAPLTVSRECVRAFPYSGEHFLEPDRFWTLRDLLASISVRFRIDGFENAEIDGNRMDWCLRRERYREWGRPTGAEYRLLYYSLLRIGPHLERRAATLVYPFENQPWEKMMCMALRERAPTLRLLGYQHSTVPRMLLSYFFGAGEVGDVPLPDELLTVGRPYQRLFRSEGMDMLPITVVGGLRYEYLERPTLRRPPGGTGARTVVLALSISPIYSALLIDAFAEALKQGLTLATGAQVKVLIKPHPHLPRFVVEQRTDLPDGFSISRSPLAEVLEAADVLVYSGVTGGCLEAIAAGVPAIKFLAPLLDIDSADVLPGQFVRTCTFANIRSVLVDVLESGRVPSRDVVRGSVIAAADFGAWADVLRRAGIAESAA